MIDTHTHLYLPEFADDADGAGAVSRALAAGVSHLVFPNVDLSTIAPMQALAARFPEHISMAMGLHPTEVNEQWRDAVDAVMALLSSDTHYVAVGEVGIDLYWDKTYEREQMLALETQLQHASRLHLPVIIHCRDGLDQVLEVMGQFPDVKAVFHSFGGTLSDVERIRAIGDHYFGINGIVTFKNCKVRDTLSEISLDRILLETDAPYLAPVPHRGKRNESAFIVHTAAHIAATLGVPLEEVDLRTSANARSFFSLK